MKKMKEKQLKPQSKFLKNYKKNLRRKQINLMKNKKKGKINLKLNKTLKMLTEKENRGKPKKMWTRRKNKSSMN